MFCLDRIIMSLDLGSRTDHWIMWRFPPRPSPSSTCVEIITCWVNLLERAVDLDLPNSHQFSTDFHSRQTSGPWPQFCFSLSSSLSRRAKLDPIILEISFGGRHPQSSATNQRESVERDSTQKECVCAKGDRRERKALCIAKREELKTAWSLSSSHKSNPRHVAQSSKLEADHHNDCPLGQSVSPWGFTNTSFIQFQ
jgi:hypothetical protein